MRQRIPSLRRVALAAAALVFLHGCASTAGHDAPAPEPATPIASPSGDAPNGKDASDGTNTLRWSLSERDKTLKTALERWSHAVGWRLIWELSVDYRIDAAASIDGTFEEAITAVMKNMEHADVPPKAIFYRGNGVLRVVARGME